VSFVVAVKDCGDRHRPTGQQIGVPGRRVEDVNSTRVLARGRPHHTGGTVYDIASALRRRAMAERLEGLQRARQGSVEPTTDRAPRPRHASEPHTSTAPAAPTPDLQVPDVVADDVVVHDALADDVVADDAPADEVVADPPTPDLQAAGERAAESRSEDLPSELLFEPAAEESAGTAATTIADLLRSGGSGLFFDRTQPRP